MKVLIVNTLYPPSTIGGAERSVALLARAAAARGHDVHVACLHADQSVQVENDGGVTVHRLPLRNRYWPFDHGERRSSIDRLLWHARDSYNPQATRDIITIAEQMKPDVLHTNNLSGFSTQIWRWASANRIRIVHTLRDYSMLCARATLFRGMHDCETRCLDCRVLTETKRSTSALVNAVASNSRYVIDEHRRFGFFNDTDTEVIFNIADGNGEAAAAPRVVGEDNPDAVTFGYIGRIEPEKGIEVVLKAFARLTSGNWRLRVAGAGKDEYVTRLMQRYPDSRIEWLGFMASDAFYARVDVAVLASVWPEPLPRTMIECLARGVPTIYSDAGGMPEIGGLSSCGMMYAKDDVDALLTNLNEVLGDPERWTTRFVPSAENLTPFTEEEVLNRYLNLYQPTPGGASI